MKFYSTNNKNLQVSFQEALLMGQPLDYGLFMMDRNNIPKLSKEEILDMQYLSYADIAFQVLYPFLEEEIPLDDLKSILEDAYNEAVIPTDVNLILDNIYIMWLTKGPTLSFKDYAARFFGRILAYFLRKINEERLILVATSGDTGSAVADALFDLKGIYNIIFYPKGEISEVQRRQMTTLKKNIFAVEVNGDFDLCQQLVKYLLGDKEFTNKVFHNPNFITSANSISLGRLLPQAVYPFYAYSRACKKGQPMIASIPSGNFGDMMGTVIAKEMGLPISKIICGVNENKTFPHFLETEKYKPGKRQPSPSSAMNVSHPSNIARLFDFYGGHIQDIRDDNGHVIQKGFINRMPDLKAMKNDIFSVSINDQSHYESMQEFYNMSGGVILDPHGAVGWHALEKYIANHHDSENAVAVIYETADPAKFADDVMQANGIQPPMPESIKKQENLKERIFSLESAPKSEFGSLSLTPNQINEAKALIEELIAYAD